MGLMGDQSSVALRSVYLPFYVCEVLFTRQRRASALTSRIYCTRPQLSTVRSRTPIQTAMLSLTLMVPLDMPPLSRLYRRLLTDCYCHCWRYQRSSRRRRIEINSDGLWRLIRAIKIEGRLMNWYCRRATTTIRNSYGVATDFPSRCFSCIDFV